MKLAITYPQHALLTTTVNVLEILMEANKFNLLINPNSKQPFDLSFLGEKPKMDHSYGNTTFHCLPFNEEIQDIVVVPAIKGFEPDAFKQNKPLLKYIKYQYKNGATLVSICSGALLLAEAGILENKKAATHWAYTDFVKNRYPNVHFEYEHPYIDAGNIITSTGSFSSNVVILYLIEKFGSRELALFTSRMYMTDYNVQNSSYFIPIDLKTKHTNDRILKIQHFVISDYNNNITVDGLAQKFNMSNRNLTKSFKEALGVNPSEYIQLVRIKKATELLENSEQNIKEIMYSIGYSDASAFRKVFKKIVGLVPTEYRLKFKRISDVQLI